MNRFCYADAHTKLKTDLVCKNSSALGDFILAVFRVSHKSGVRSEGTVNFPRSLTVFFTFCAKPHIN